MALVAHSQLPAFERLRAEGVNVLDAQEARSFGGLDLHLGLLNLMPDAALEATERQFLRLLANSNRLAAIYVHPFTVVGVARAAPAASHVEAHYEDFGALRRAGLDALVVTGANPATADITQESFWPGMIEAIEWGRRSVHSVLCSCLATHAVVKHYHGIERIRLPSKRWGVYSHRVVDTDHPLLLGVNTRFDAPHSHLNEVTREQLESVGIRVLAQSGEAGVHLAVSEDGLRFVYFQGHPEYDINSLLKEYKREIERFASGDREYPAPPAHYFDGRALARLREFESRLREWLAGTGERPRLPEAELAPRIDNTWSDTGKAMISNWLGLVIDAAKGAGEGAQRIRRSA